jgi:hypothetical protein
MVFEPQINLACIVETHKTTYQKIITSLLYMGCILHVFYTLLQTTIFCFHDCTIDQVTFKMLG